MYSTNPFLSIDCQD